MTPFADPSLPVYARVVLAVLFIAMWVALFAALAGLIMGTDHPAALAVEIGLILVGIAVGKAWDRRRPKDKQPLR